MRADISLTQLAWRNSRPVDTRRGKNSASGPRNDGVIKGKRKNRFLFSLDALFRRWQVDGHERWLMANGSFGHRGSRAEAFLSRGVHRCRGSFSRSIDRPTDRPTEARLVPPHPLSYLSILLAERPQADTRRYRQRDWRRWEEARRSVYPRASGRLESGSTRIDVTCPIIVQGRVRKKSLGSSREEHRNEAKWIGPPIGVRVRVRTRRLTRSSQSDVSIRAIWIWRTAINNDDRWPLRIPYCASKDRDYLAN